MRKIGDQTSFLFMEPINTYITMNEVIQRENSKDICKYIFKKKGAQFSKYLVLKHLMSVLVKRSGMYP